MDKAKEYWAQFVAFMNRQWWGMKIVYWLAICLVLIITAAFFVFRKPKKSKKF